MGLGTFFPAHRAGERNAAEAGADGGDRWLEPEGGYGLPVLSERAGPGFDAAGGGGGLSLCGSADVVDGGAGRGGMRGGGVHPAGDAGRYSGAAENRGEEP